jgi:type II secretory ATPase GspE/PulE/Tfp pilus assembly ATPase PilB-like protein
MPALSSADSLLTVAARRSGAQVSDEVLLSLARESALDNRSMIDALLDSGDVDEDKFLRALSEELGMPWQDDPRPDSEVAVELKQLCSAQSAIRNRVIPVGYEGGKMVAAASDEEQAAAADSENEPDPVKAVQFACYDPFQCHQRQAIQKVVDGPVHWVMTSRRRLIEALQDVYGVGAETFEELIASRDLDGGEGDLLEEVNVLDEDDAEASVVKFVNQIIKEALSQRATDIHVEPLEHDLRIRYRIDGVLRSAPVPENIKSLQSSVIARLKVMSRLDIAEKRLPQDGRIQLRLDGQPIDVRVATIPGVEGESVSLRLLGQERFTLDRLGMLPDIRTKIDDLIEKPNGIILVTGPTGCGKSTSLYCFLSALNNDSRRIVTIEDPVENKLEGVVQIAVKPEIDLTFAGGLRSILRGDPNVIMVGEIRDLETAEIAIRAALTGHLVLSTLHTNDAIGGITRLIDMGVEPFLVSASVRAFMAQRLVRQLCQRCRVPAQHDEAFLRRVGVPASARENIFAANPDGCEYCRKTGFRGRLAIYETLVVTKKLEALISARAAEADIARQAMLDGFRSMRDYGWDKVAAGETTVEEVVGVTEDVELSSVGSQ